MPREELYKLVVGESQVGSFVVSDLYLLSEGTIFDASGIEVRLRTRLSLQHVCLPSSSKINRQRPPLDLSSRDAASVST